MKCRYEEDGTLCLRNTQLVADTSQPFDAEYDNGKDIVLLPSFRLVPLKHCYYHKKKSQGLFNVTVEQIRKEKKRAAKGSKHHKKW